MKKFQTIALVSAMAFSANTMAMQALDDDTLSATTGQDGISIGVKLGTSGISIGEVFLHDNDGLEASASLNFPSTVANPAYNAGAQQAYDDHLTSNPGDTAGAQAAADAVAGGAYTVGAPATIGSLTTSLGGTDTAGAIIIRGLNITQVNAANNLLDLDIDADGSSAGAFLNIGAKVDAMNVSIGSIGVGKSGTLSTVTATRGIESGSDVDILSNINLKLGAMDANVQLGNTPQGAMILLSSEIQGGIDIDGLEINDAAAGGLIKLDNIYLRGAGNTTGNLDVKAKIGVDTDGLTITSQSNQGINTYIKGIHLGDATNASIGDLEINNLNIAGSTITVRGH